MSEQIKFRLNEIIGIKNYFHREIDERKSCSKKLSKYVTTFDYIAKILIALSGIASANFTLIFSLTTVIIKKLLRITRNKNKKHDKILMLAKGKLDSIETLVSHTVID